MAIFCRHNRFTAECPICSKGTVLDPERRVERKRAAGPRAPRRAGAAREAAPPARGPHFEVGPYEDEESARYVVRLESVPGGVRMAEWAGAQLRRRAPVLPAGDLGRLVAGAVDALTARDGDALRAVLDGPAPEPPAGADDARGDDDGHPTGAGVSRGRTGDFREELRVEVLPGQTARVGRWVLRPGAGWQLQDAAPMLPATRFAEALADASAQGLVSTGGTGSAASGGA